MSMKGVTYFFLDGIHRIDGWCCHGFGVVSHWIKQKALHNNFDSGCVKL